MRGRPKTADPGAYRARRCLPAAAAVILLLGAAAPLAALPAPDAFDPRAFPPINLQSVEGKVLRVTLLDYDHGKQRAKVSRETDGRIFWVRLDLLSSASAREVEDWGIKRQAALGLRMSARTVSFPKSAARFSGQIPKAFEVNIRNLSEAPLDDLRVEYQLVKKDGEAIPFTRRSNTPDIVSGAHPLKDLPARGEAKFETDRIHLSHKKVKIIKIVEYTDGTSEKVGGANKSSRDSLKGVWCRVYCRGSMVMEWAQPPSLIDTSQWVDQDHAEPDPAEPEDAAGDSPGQPGS